MTRYDYVFFGLAFAALMCWLVFVRAHLADAVAYKSDANKKEIK